MDCKPIINGYVCSVSLEELNKFKSAKNLRFKIKDEGGRKRVIFSDGKKIVANAFKYNGSNTIQLIVKK